MKNIGEFATGIIVKCAAQRQTHNRCDSGEIHYLYSNNFAHYVQECEDEFCVECEDIDECDEDSDEDIDLFAHAFGQDNYLVRNWRMHKYTCDNSECDIKCHVFECGGCKDFKLHAVRCLNFDGELYQNHACQFASKCQSIFCEQHWKDYGVTCDLCSKYICLNCCAENGYHCRSGGCSKYCCANCVKAEASQNVPYPFYCETCSA